MTIVRRLALSLWMVVLPLPSGWAGPAARHQGEETRAVGPPRPLFERPAEQRPVTTEGTHVIRSVHGRPIIEIAPVWDAESVWDADSLTPSRDRSFPVVPIPPRDPRPPHDRLLLTFAPASAAPAPSDIDNAAQAIRWRQPGRISIVAGATASLRLAENRGTAIRDALRFRGVAAPISIDTDLDTDTATVRLLP